MTEYFSNSWNYEMEKQIRWQTEKGNFKKITLLYGSDAILVGHALWHYIGQKHGDKAISNILYMSKLTDDIDGAFQYVLGKDLQTVLLEMAEFYRTQTSTPKQTESSIDVPKRLAKRTVTAVELNYDASKMAYVTNKSGKVGLWIYDFESGKNKKI